MTMETESVVMRPQAKERQRLLAISRGWDRAWGRFRPTASQGTACQPQDLSVQPLELGDSQCLSFQPLGLWCFVTQPEQTDTLVGPAQICRVCQTSSWWLGGGTSPGKYSSRLLPEECQLPKDSLHNPTGLYGVCVCCGLCLWCGGCSVSGVCGVVCGLCVWCV